MKADSLAGRDQVNSCSIREHYIAQGKPRESYAPVPVELLTASGKSDELAAMRHIYYLDSFKLRYLGEPKLTKIMLKWRYPSVKGGKENNGSVAYGGNP